MSDKSKIEWTTHGKRIFYPGFIKKGKKASGRLLDGVEYSQYPEVRL